MPRSLYSRASGEPPVTPAGYLSIATRLLFDRSRNSTVVDRTATSATASPPMPPLPVYHGMMNLGGSGPTAFFSTGADAPTRRFILGRPSANSSS